VTNETAEPRIRQRTGKVAADSAWRNGLGKGWAVFRLSAGQAKIIAGLITIVSFALDCYLPVPLNVSKLYLFTVVVLAWTRSVRWLWGGTAVVAVLSIAILLVRGEPAGNAAIVEVDWANRVFTAGMLLVVACLVHGGMAKLAARERAEEALQRAEADFARAARISMLGELTALIAHELKQPLAAIAINGDVVVRCLAGPAPNVSAARETVEHILSEAWRAAGIIDRIRKMAVRQTPEQTPLSLDEVIDEALMVLRAELQSRGVTVFHPLAADASPVLADRIQLQQVIVNLAINAIQAMEHAHSPQRTLTISVTMPSAATVRCTIEDSGPGVEAGHVEHLFERFFTTKESGMGMGLSICRSIVEAHGGKIAADAGSAHGGARFYFTFPAAEAMH